MSRLVLILGDQLSPSMAALKAADKATDTVVMAEVADEASYVPHHPKKIAFLFAAMRKFAARLEAEGWRVRYTRLDDPDNAGSIVGELLRAAQATGATDVLATEPGEWRLIEELRDCPLPVTQLEDDRFIASHAEFETWADGRKELRMEYFYREMRRKTEILMDGDKPAGGKWNFDHANRKPAKDGLFRQEPPRFAPDPDTQAVLDLVAERFDDNFGDLLPFDLAVDEDGALKCLDHFIEHRLADFGTYQDAMLQNDPVLNHSLLSLYINCGLLDPLEVCRRAEAAWKAGSVPINSAEGFIRQIIGWREYMRGIYFRGGPDYVASNALGHRRALPEFFWTGETEMNCMAHVIGQTKEMAYAHHIQRLMVTGNWALLAGIDPYQVHEWYLAVYFDAYEWVEAPNVIGMSQYADGGVVGSKPYVSSGNYIDRMSDYCKSCRYDVKAKLGQTACPFNLLYWHFLDRHRDRFEKNPRMAQMYRTWDKMDDVRKVTILREAEAYLERLGPADEVWKEA